MYSLPVWWCQVRDRPGTFLWIHEAVTDFFALIPLTTQFTPLMTLLAVGMLANVCIDITEVNVLSFLCSLNQISSVLITHWSWRMCGYGTMAMRLLWLTSSLRIFYRAVLWCMHSATRSSIDIDIDRFLHQTLLAIFTYKKQAEAEEIMATLNTWTGIIKPTFMSRIPEWHESNYRWPLINMALVFWLLPSAVRGAQAPAAAQWKFFLFFLFW